MACVTALLSVNDDPTTKLAKDTGFVTVSRSGNAAGAAYADVRYLGVTADANTDVASELFVRYQAVMATVGAFEEIPVRKNKFGGNTEYEKLKASLPVGVDIKEKWQTSIKGVIDDVIEGLSVGDRWGVSDGQLETASKMVNARVMSQVIRKYIDGEVSLDDAANEIVAKHKISKNKNLQAALLPEADQTSFA